MCRVGDQEVTSVRYVSDISAFIFNSSVFHRSSKEFLAQAAVGVLTKLDKQVELSLKQSIFKTHI